MPKKPDAVREFRAWLLDKQDELDAMHDWEPDDQAWEASAIIVHEAGVRAARLGLTQLYQVSRRYPWSVTTRDALAFLSDCLKGLPKEKPDTLTPPQAARILGVNPDKVLGWIRSGELKASNLAKRQGGRPKYRIAGEDLQAFRNRRTVQPRQKPKPRPAWHGKTYF